MGRHWRPESLQRIEFSHLCTCHIIQFSSFFFILCLPSSSGALSSVSLNILYCKENLHLVHLEGHILNDLLSLKGPVELVGTLTLSCIISSRKALTWSSLVLCYLFHMAMKKMWVTIIGKNKVNVKKLGLIRICVNYMILPTPTDFIICYEATSCFRLWLLTHLFILYLVTSFLLSTVNFTAYKLYEIHSVIYFPGNV